MLARFLSWLSPWRKEPVESACEGGCPEVIAGAQKRRREAFATRPEVDALSGSLRAHGVRNHFGESLERIYGGA